MHIAANTRFLIPGQLEGYGVYTREIMSRIARNHAGDRIDMYFDRNPDPEFRFAGNVELHHVYPPARHPVLFYLWYQVNLKKRLNSLAPDVFFSPDGFMPVGLTCPTVITIHDLAVLRYPDHVKRSESRYYREKMPEFARKAGHILTVSHFSKKEIVDLLDVRDEKVTVVYNGISDRFKPLEEPQKAGIRSRLTSGAPYLLYTGAVNPRKNIDGLIAGFETFREKNPSSDLKLVIAGRFSWKYNKVRSALEHSRYRNDIITTGYISDAELPLVMGGAEGFAYLSLYEGFGMPVLEAMACGVPVLTSEETSMAEIGGDAVLTVNPRDPGEIADSIQEIITNRSLRASLVDKGFARMSAYSWQRASEEVYTVLQDHGLRK